MLINITLCTVNKRTYNIPTTGATNIAPQTRTQSSKKKHRALECMVDG